VQEYAFWLLVCATEIVFDVEIVLLMLTVRLGGSGLPLEGRLEFYYNGSWGTVCDDSFDIVDATVACRSINAR